MKKNYKFIPSTLSQETTTYIKSVYDALVESGQLNDKNESIYISNLVMLAFSYETFLKAQKELLEGSLLTYNSSGSEKTNPLLNIAVTAQRQVISLQQEFGLSIRTKDKVKKDETANNPLADFLKGDKK